MIKHKFQMRSYDWCVYYKKLGFGKFMYLLLYVDDMLITCQDLEEVTKSRKEQNTKFENKDLGRAQKNLGTEIVMERTRGLLFLSQGKYLEKVLERFGFSSVKPVQVPLAPHFKLNSDVS